MRSRLAELRREIQRFQRPDRPRAARYPRELRREIGRLARQARASGTSFAALARRLGVAPTLVLRARQPGSRSPRRTPSAVRPVVVTPVEASPAEHTVAVVTLPSGTRVEGLSVPQIVALVRALA
jgi:transposase-like protein